MKNIITISEIIYILFCFKKYKYIDYFITKKIITLYSLKKGYEIPFTIELDIAEYFITRCLSKGIVYDQLLKGAIERNYLVLVKILRKHICFNNINYDAIYQAVKHKRYNILKYILNYSNQYKEIYSGIIDYTIINEDIIAFEILIKKYKHITIENTIMLAFSNKNEMIQIIDKYIK